MLNNFETKQIGGLRYYNTPLGYFPSVTTVLSSTLPLAKSNALAKWRETMGEDAADRVLQYSFKRGNSVHLSIENYFKRQDGNLANSEFPQLISQLNPLISQIDSPQFIEIPTYHPLGYSGSPDLIANYNNQLCVIDWKTSNKPKPKAFIQDYILQVSAYVFSANYTHKIRVQSGLIVVLVENNSKAQLFPLTLADLEDGFTAFKNRLDSFYKFYPQEF